MSKCHTNIYFRLRFGLVNLINAYLSLKSNVVRWEYLFLNVCVIIELAIPNLIQIRFAIILKKM